MSAFRKLLRCYSIEDCQRIQKGHLFLRRIGKYSILFTIAITVFINDIFAKLIDIVTGQYESARHQYNSTFEEYNKVTGSVLYRWTFGWFHNPPSVPSVPELDRRVITTYNIINFIQFSVFLITMIWCLRWVYADCRVEQNKFLTFGKLMLIATITNLILYIFLKKTLYTYWT